MSRKFKTGVETTTLKVTTGAGTANVVLVLDSTGAATPTALPALTVYHGATASTARPTPLTAQPVTWVGSVEPTNASNNDIWVDIS